MSGDMKELKKYGDKTTRKDIRAIPRRYVFMNAHQRARALAQNAHPDLLHWDHGPGETQRGDTTGRHNGETQRGDKGEKEQNEKSCFRNILKMLKLCICAE